MSKSKSNSVLSSLPSCELCGGQRGVAAGPFLNTQVFHCQLFFQHSPLSIIMGCQNRPIWGCSVNWLVLTLFLQIRKYFQP